MRLSFLVLSIVLLIPALPSWAGEAVSGLVGHWELVEEKYRITIEFKDNGAYIALTERGVMTGRWEQLDESHVSTWSSDRLPKRVSEFSIDEDTLVITDEGGTGLTHRRILLATP